MGQFSQKLDRFAREVPKVRDRIVRKIVFDLLRAIVLRTPVDTGLAQGNWQVGVAVPPRAVLDRHHAGWVMDEMSKLADYQAERGPVFIVNNVHYVIWLEEGSSSQAPAGMVAVTVHEWLDIVRRHAG